MYWDLVHPIGCDGMEFFRVNEHMVKCVVTEEDMDQYDVSIEDFFTRSENAMEFLHVIVQQASEEVGYKPQGPLTSLQIAPVEEHGLAIFLTEKPQFDLKTVINALKKDAGIAIPDEVFDQVERATDEERTELFQKFLQNIHKELEKGLDASIRTNSDGTRHLVSLDRKIFAFDKVSDLFGYVKAVELPKEVGSSLYKDQDHDTYYLIVDRNESEAGTLAGVYLTAYEYGHFVSEKAEHALFIKEHCECLIAENAIGKLKGN